MGIVGLDLPGNGLIGGTGGVLAADAVHGHGIGFFHKYHSFLLRAAALYFIIWENGGTIKNGNVNNPPESRRRRREGKKFFLNFSRKDYQILQKCAILFSIPEPCDSSTSMSF